MTSILKLKYIEKKSKEVIFNEKYRWITQKTQNLIERLELLIECIKKGLDVPENYYSRDFTQVDELLKKTAVMHLHLSDTELVYLIQYSDRIEILEVSDHRYVDRSIKPMEKRIELLLKRFQLSPKESPKVEIKPKKKLNKP